MAYTLQQYNPLSHLGQLLYQDSVAERDARLKQQTEEARQQSATDAFARQQQLEALYPALKVQALADPEIFGKGTAHEGFLAGSKELLRSRLTPSQVDVIAGLPGAPEKLTADLSQYQQRAKLGAQYLSGVSNLRMLSPQLSYYIKQLSALTGAAGTGASTLTEMLGGIKGLDSKRLNEIINSPDRRQLDIMLAQLNHVASALRQSLPGGVQVFPELPTSAESPEKVISAIGQLEQLVKVSNMYADLVRAAQAEALKVNAQLEADDYEELFIAAFNRAVED